MQLLLSPAKLMNFKDKTESVAGATPLFTDKTNLLVKFCQQLSVEEIAKLLKINMKMAHDVYGYYQKIGRAHV